MRPHRNQHFLAMAALIALRGTCARRQVGCVLVNQHNYVLATGYNGTVREQPHCTDAPCEGASLPSGSGLDLCEAIHAEQNALLQCGDINKIVAVYCTALPCPHCLKMLLNTSMEMLCFLDSYPSGTRFEETPQYALLKKLRHRRLVVGQYGLEEVWGNTESAPVLTRLRLDPARLTPAGTWEFPNFSFGRRDEGPQA